MHVIMQLVHGDAAYWAGWSGIRSLGCFPFPIFLPLRITTTNAIG